MKKIILTLGTLTLSLVFLNGVPLFNNSSDLTLEALAGCTPTISETGPIITVTVCDRKTSFMDSILGIDCGTSATTTCSFSNV